VNIISLTKAIIRVMILVTAMTTAGIGGRVIAYLAGWWLSLGLPLQSPLNPLVVLNQPPLSSPVSSRLS
jgi:hypothetical protein